MKAKIINPFLDATINLFQKTFDITPTPGAPYLLKLFGNHRWEISGVIGLTGVTKGVVVIRLTKILSSKLLEKSGLEYHGEKEREELVNGMVDEFVNVIAGNALTTLSQYDIRISVPFIIQGPNHTVAWPKHGPIVCVPFATESGPFEISVSLQDIITEKVILQ